MLLQSLSQLAEFRWGQRRKRQEKWASMGRSRKPAARNCASRIGRALGVVYPLAAVSIVALPATALAQEQQLPAIQVIANTPLPGSGIDVDKVPASVNIVDANQIQRTDSLNISDALQKYVPGIIVNEVAGNPFQPNVQFRGFVASPVAGTPQGLAVYQNGVRINEAFGDTVNWDLIPTAAIRSVAVVTNNPAFGLNAWAAQSRFR